MGTAISCTECSQVAGLIQKSVETPRKYVQLFTSGRCASLIIFREKKSAHSSLTWSMLSGVPKNRNGVERKMGGELPRRTLCS